MYCGNAEMVDLTCIRATFPDCMLLNCELSGPVAENAIPGWHTHNADLSITDHDGRASVLRVGDAGSFSSVHQSVQTVPGQQYFVQFDVWAEPLNNVADNAYCSSTDSNGLLDIHEGSQPPPPEPACEDGGFTMTNSGFLDFSQVEDNQDCRWQLICSSGSPTVSFNSFLTERNQDYVNIFDGNSTAATRIVVLHGTTVPAAVTGSERTMLVQFTSDDSVTLNGFRGVFTCGDAAAPFSIINSDLSGPVTDNTIPGWHTHNADLLVADHDGRTDVLHVADFGNFSSVYQTVQTVPGQRYFVQFDVWAEPLNNVADNAYCSSTDSNGLVDIHEGTAETVSRHGEFRVCPIENQPGTWQTADGIYEAVSNTTTLALHSEGGWTAYFDSIRMTIADIAPENTYLGCFLDSDAHKHLVDDNGRNVGQAVSSGPIAVTEEECALVCTEYKYMGLSWTNWCICGNEMVRLCPGGAGGNQGRLCSDSDEGYHGQHTEDSCNARWCRCDIDSSENTVCGDGDETCGWRVATYELGGNDPCTPEGVTVTDSGEIDFSRVEDNRDCRWQLACSAGQPTVTFSSFETAGNEYVNIFDGQSTSADRLARLQGASIPNPVTGSGASMLVQFTSDDSMSSNSVQATLSCAIRAAVAQHGEYRVCPIENEPGTWQRVVGLYKAEAEFTTLVLHSEGDWAAYFDSITVTPLGASGAGDSFFYDGTLRNWDGSVDFCTSQGAVIASIHSQEECDLVDAMFPNSANVYLGGFSDGQGNWEWVDGTPFDYRNPEGDGISGRGETKLVFSHQHTGWHDWGQGQNENGVICRYPPQPESDDLETYCDADAYDYRGTLDVTVSGRVCQFWAAQTPHSHEHTPANFPEVLQHGHNYCRNPDGKSTAWCYTTDPSTRWEFCDVGDVATSRADCPTFIETPGSCRADDGGHDYYRSTVQASVQGCTDYCHADAACHAFDIDWPFAHTCRLFRSRRGVHTGNGISSRRCYSEAAPTLSLQEPFIVGAVVTIDFDGSTSAEDWIGMYESGTIQEEVDILNEFEAENEAEMRDGWSNEKITDTGNGNRLLHGPWGREVQFVTKEIQVVSNYPRCQVSWRSFNFGSRDGHEWDRLEIDGNEVWSMRSQHCDRGLGWLPLSEGVNWGGGGHGCYVDVRVVVQCAGTMNLRFTSAIDEGINNEAWAFSNVLVVPSHRPQPDSDEEWAERVSQMRANGRRLSGQQMTNWVYTSGTQTPSDTRLVGGTVQMVIPRLGRYCFSMLTNEGPYAGVTRQTCIEAALLDCINMTASAGTTFETCVSDGVLLHAEMCMANCTEGGVVPYSCWNGTVSAGQTCCSAGSGWDGFHGSTCADCQPGMLDHDANPVTQCVACAAGQFSQTIGALACQSCPAGGSTAAQWETLADRASIEAAISLPFSIDWDDNDRVLGQILDGGSNMYDGGNRITTSLCRSRLRPYTENMTAVDSNCFGQGGIYMMDLRSSMMVMLTRNTHHEDLTISISGNLGADGAGVRITANFTSGPLTGFMTSVCGAAGIPSVNHLFIINGAISPDAAHEVDPSTDSDGDSVSGIGPGSPILYMLYSSTSGGCKNQEERVLSAVFVAAVMALSAPDAAAPNCAECAAGYADTDSDPGTPCVHCPAGQYSAAVGEAECEGELCSPGSYSEPGSVAASDCIDCAVGLYDADAEPATPCVECSSGMYTAAAGSTECLGEGCGSGTYAPRRAASAAAAECVDCRPGYFDRDADPVTLCEPCPAGRFSAAARAATECPGLCLPGNYSAPASTSASDCVSCVAGAQDHDSDTSTPCVDCPSGLYSNAGSVQCMICIPGKVAYEDGSGCSGNCSAGSAYERTDDMTSTISAGEDNLLHNGLLDGPISNNAISGWDTTDATISLINLDGRFGVISVADDGPYSSISQTINTTAGTKYFVSFDVWATPLVCTSEATCVDNACGPTRRRRWRRCSYCAAGDSNGQVEIHHGTVDVTRSGDERVCPVRRYPRQWHSSKGLFTATEETTTIGLRSEGGWTAYFDRVTVVEAPPTPNAYYVGCFIEVNSDCGNSFTCSGGVQVSGTNAMNAEEGRDNCAVSCAGWKYFGLQGDNLCRCTNMNPSEWSDPHGDWNQEPRWEEWTRNADNTWNIEPGEAGPPYGQAPLAQCDADAWLDPSTGVADGCGHRGERSQDGHCGNRNAVYMNTMGLTSTCNACTAGQYDDDFEPITECVHCMEGRFSSTEGATECTGQCPPGSYSASGAVAEADCVQCLPGHYDADSDAATPCELCPAGQHAEASGSTACQEVDCSPGTFNSGTSAECVECVPGFADSDSEASTPCALCAAGYFSADVGSSSCTQCDEGTFNVAGGSRCFESMWTDADGHAMEGVSTGDTRAEITGSLSSSLSLEGGYFSDLQVDAGEGSNQAFGGAMAVLAARVTIRATLLNGNRAGGDCDAEDDGCDGNSWWGGAAYISDASVVAIEDSVLSTNSAGSGGAVHIVAGSTLTLQTTHFVGNSATSGGGGGLHAASGSHVVMLTCGFTDNSASLGGGAVFITEGSDATMTACEFVSNDSPTGGALLVEGASSVTVQTSHFVSNTASTAGGAVHIAGASMVEILATIFNSNGVGTRTFTCPCAGESCCTGCGNPCGLDTQCSIDACDDDLCGCSAAGQEAGCCEFDAEIVTATGIEGGALHVSDSSFVTVRDCTFQDSTADKGAHMLANDPAFFKVYNANFEPFVPGSASVNINILAGCEQYPCDLGYACSYSRYSLMCSACPGSTVGTDGISCAACEVGFGPNTNKTACQPCAATDFGVGVCQQCAPPNVVSEDRTACVGCPAGQQPLANQTGCSDCIGNTYSEFGIQCQSCATGTVANDLRTQCNPIAQGSAITDPAVLDQVLNGTQFLRPTASLEFDVSDDVLVDGSSEQQIFFDELEEDLTEALGASAGEIQIVGIRRQTANEGRRRAQSSSAQVDFEIASAAAATIMAELSSQLTDPDSALRTSGGSLSTINPEVVPVFDVVCPPGKLLLSGAADCTNCANTQQFVRDGNCQDCVAALGQEPNEVGDACVCMPQYYNTSIWGPINCYVSDFTSPKTSMPVCQTCEDLSDCVDDCEGGNITISVGWAAMVGAQISVTSGDTVNNVAPLRVFECADGVACLGGLAPATQCAEGHLGAMCGTCIDEWTKSDREIVCSKCGEWSVMGGFMILVLFALCVALLLHIHRWYGATVIFKEMVELLSESRITEIGRITVSSVDGYLNI